MPVRVVVDTTEGHVWIRAAGELDVSSAAGLQRTGEDALADGHDVVLLDLSGILFLDSAGLGVLIALHRSALAHDAHLAVVAASTAVRRVVELMGAGHVLALHETVEDAVGRR